MSSRILHLFVGICACVLIELPQGGQAQHFLRNLLFPWITGPPALPALRQPTAFERPKFPIDRRDILGTNEISMEEERPVRFFLYPDHVHQNESDEIIPWDKKSLELSRYNPKLPLILLLHGFQTDDASIRGPNVALKSAYLDVRYPANIIGVDWGRLVNRLNRDSDYLPSILLYYFDVTPEAVSIATTPVSDIIIFLMQSNALKGPEYVHMVGFSLGAQLAGSAASDVRRRIGRKIYRVTGLDPAGPLFTSQAEDRRLSPDDAHFVDVTHTNQAVYGYIGDAGHTDWYINGGGPGQPGCSLTGLLQRQCQHNRAFYYFADSIRGVKYFGCRCDSKQCQKPRHGKCHDFLYGQYADQKLEGSFYLDIVNNPISYVDIPPL